MARTRQAAVTTSETRSVGTARRIDQLGRVVVPAELRKMIGIKAGDLIDFRLIDNYIAIMKIQPECALCGNADDLIERRGKHVCSSCLQELRLQPECAICGRLDDLVEQHGKHVCTTCVREIASA